MRISVQRLSSWSVALLILLVSCPAFARSDQETGRSLYDRNKRLRQYQRQRGESPCQRRCGRGCYYQDEHGDYYYTGRGSGPDMTYWDVDAHPDNAGNEDR